jgi:hypothetical protein
MDQFTKKTLFSASETRGMGPELLGAGAFRERSDRVACAKAWLGSMSQRIATGHQRISIASRLGASLMLASFQLKLAITMSG